MRWNLKKRGVVLVSMLFLVSSTVYQVYSSPLVGIDENEWAPMGAREQDIPERYVIKDVPIVGQDSRFYCTMASHTMILNYYGFNLTKYEIFYLMGGGFSLLWHERAYLNPYTGFGCAFRPSNYEFVASVLNLSFQPFYADVNDSDDELWDHVWTSIMENVSIDQPVVVSVDSFILYLDNNGFHLPSYMRETVPLRADHAVAVVGYNNSNRSVCYHDPLYSILGDETKGSYLWVDSNVFQTAFSRFSINYSSTYRIQSYENPDSASYDKEQMMLRAFQRNIKRLQGDYRFYTSLVDYPDSYNYTRNFSYGINASKQIQRILGDGIQTQLFTLEEYEKTGRFGFLNTFLFMLEKSIHHMFNNDISFILDLSIPGYKNNYRIIAEEREVISEVMKQYSHLSPVFHHCAELLQNESDLWFEIASYHRLLLNKGVFLSIPRALWIFNQMAGIMDDIIHVQQEIISISS